MVAICKVAREEKLPDLATDDDRMRYIHTIVRHRVWVAKKLQRAAWRGGGHRQIEVDLDLRPAPPAPDGSMAERSDELERFIDSIEDPLVREIARGLCQEQTHREIAERLGVSERTVRRKRKDVARLFARWTRNE